MHIHDAGGIALFPVGGREGVAPDQADDGEQNCCTCQTGQRRFRQPQKPAGIGEPVQGKPGSSAGRGRGVREGIVFGQSHSA